MKHIKIYILALLICVCYDAVAQTAAFLNISPDSRAASMSSDGTVAKAGAWSHFGNTAASSFYDGKGSIALTYSLLQPGRTGNYYISAGGFGKAGKRFSVTGGIKYFGYAKQTAYNADACPVGEFTPKEIYAGAGLGVKILEWLAAGVNAGYVFSDMGGTSSAHAFSADISLMADLKFMRIGLAGRNLGTSLNYGYGGQLLPMNVCLGVATSQMFGKHGIGASAEGSFIPESMSFNAGIGAEYIYDNLFRIGAGWRYGHGPDANATCLSAGIGLLLRGFSLDLTYLNGLKADSAINNSFLVSLGYAF